MREPLRTTLAAPLVGALTFALADFVLAAHVEGAHSESYAAVVRPLAFFVAAALAAGLAGAALGVLAAPWLAASRTASAAGFGLAGATTSALLIAVGEPHPAFSSLPRQILLWTSVWAVLGVLFVAARSSPAAKLGARVGQAAPALLAGAAGYQLLAGAPAPLRWAVLTTGLAVAAWLAARPRHAAPVSYAMAALALAAPFAAPGRRVPVSSGVISGAAAQLDPPRVILITIDALRADEPGFAGGQASTPNLDRLAAESVAFERAYSTSGWTLPALSSLHLGVSPWVHGAWTWADRPSPSPRSLAQRFSDAGYVTARIGSNFFLTSAGAGPALAQGFQVSAAYPKRVRPRTDAFQFLVKRPWIDLDVEASTDDLFAWAADWVEANRQAPFFLWLHIYDPHQPYLPPAGFAPGGRAPAVGDPDADPEQRPKTPEQAARMRALYRAEIAYVDDRLGRLLERLRALGLYEDSLLALTSDHGDEFHEHGGFGHGHTLFDELLRVPLLFNLPGAARPQRISGRVSTLGLAPTLLALANVDYDPADFSAGPLAFEERPEAPIFAAGIMEGEPQEAVLFDGLKLIRHVGFGGERLYDLIADAGEQVNLAGERPDDVRRGIGLLLRHNESSQRLRQRLGVTNGPVREYGPAEKKRLRSLGYIR